jgi:hypothetical protein
MVLNMICGIGHRRSKDRLFCENAFDCMNMRQFDTITTP